MIEYKPKFLSGANWQGQLRWMELDPHLKLDQLSFLNMNIKIRNTTYTNKNKAFRKAFEQEKMWETLSEA
jgi:hypothetical protein